MNDAKFLFSETLWLLRNSFISFVCDYPALVDHFNKKNRAAEIERHALLLKAENDATADGTSRRQMSVKITKKARRVFKQAYAAQRRMDAVHLACIMFAAFFLESCINELGMRLLGKDMYLRRYERLGPVQKWRQIPEAVYQQPLKPPALFEALVQLFGWRNRIAHDKRHDSSTNWEEGIEKLLQRVEGSDRQEDIMLNLPVDSVILTVVAVDEAYREISGSDEGILLVEDARTELSNALHKVRTVHHPPSGNLAE